MNDNHHDLLDRELEAAHRAFNEGHAQQRDDLLARLDAPDPAMPPQNRKTFSASITRRWIMRSTAGLAAAIAIAAAVIGFGTGLGTATLVWADVRANVENATAMHYRQAVVVLDAQGNTARELSGSENWSADDGRSRFVSFDSEGQPQSEMVVGHDATLTLVHSSRHAMLATSEKSDHAAPPRGRNIDGADAGSPLDMLLRMTDESATRVGEEQINGQPAVRFDIAMADTIAFYLREQGVDSAEDVKIEAAFGGSIEELAKLPPLQIWISTATGLPLRMQMPMADAMAQMMRVELPEGGGIAARFDFLGWNEEIDDAAFTADIPDGWALDRSHTIYLGGPTDLTPDDAELVTAGVPLAEGVAFRLMNVVGEVIATEADVIGVTKLSRRTGYEQGGTEDQWDIRTAKLRFTDTVNERIDQSLGNNRSGETWTFTLGDDIAGKVAVMHLWRGSAQSGLRDGAELDGINLGDLNFETFRAEYLRDE